MPRFEEQKLYIGGRYVDASGGATFETVNPANGEVLARVQRATKEDVDRAVASAIEGQKIWAAMTAMQRSRILRRAVDILRERNDELAELETLDTGKPLSETRAVDIATGKVEKVVGGGSISSFAIAGDTLVFTRNSLHSGDQVFVASLSNPQAERALTPSAGEVLPEVAFGQFEQFSFKGWNDETVYGYVVKPWNYEEGKRYPVAFLIHGGPQGSFGNSWSYRWNPQTYAGQGYAVVMIDFHGSTGYGQAFTDSISGDWGGKPLVDLQKGWEAAQQK
nr:hypothetical protein [Gammaproteobacteria bacterium]